MQLSQFSSYSPLSTVTPHTFRHQVQHPDCNNTQLTTSCPLQDLLNISQQPESVNPRPIGSLKDHPFLAACDYMFSV